MEESTGIKKDMETCTTCKAAISSFIYLGRTSNMHHQKLDGIATVCLKHMKIFGFDLDKVEGSK